jgi:cytosine/adenosine deaminase-related metal-dependent hydrolase
MPERLVVRSDHRGVWRVEPEGGDRILSAHVSETAAERAAAVHAAETGAEEIVVYDRYFRVHSKRASPAPRRRSRESAEM